MVVKVSAAMSLGMVVAACSAGGGADPHLAANSELATDAGSDAHEDAHEAVAPDDIGVPVGACLPRKTEDVPVVKMGPTRVGYPIELVQHFVRKGARAGVDGCVQAARERDPKLEGKIVLHFELPTTGGIKGATVSRGVGDHALHECIIGAVEQSPMPVLREGGKTIIDHFGVVVCPDGHTEWPTESGFR